jgi:hypothetical protein
VKVRDYTKSTAWQESFTPGSCLEPEQGSRVCTFRDGHVFQSRDMLQRGAVESVLVDNYEFENMEE